MTGKTHLSFGLATGVASAALLEPNSTILGLGVIGCTVLGSLIPDIDQSSSKLGKKVKPISKITNKMFGHRGFIHSPACLFITYLIVTMLLNYYNLETYKVLLIGYVIGYAGHLFLDMLTKGGIPLLYPFNRKKIHLTNVKTGGKGEKALFVFACVVALVIMGFYVANKVGIIYG